MAIQLLAWSLLVLMQPQFNCAGVAVKPRSRALQRAKPVSADECQTRPSLPIITNMTGLSCAAEFSRYRMVNLGGKVLGAKHREKYARLLKAENGSVLCRWCGISAVIRPRRTFCSAACVHEYRLRTSMSYVRSCVLKRDFGECESCHRNAHALFIATGSGHLPTANCSGATGLMKVRLRRRLATCEIMRTLLSSQTIGQGSIAWTNKSASRRRVKNRNELLADCAAMAERQWGRNTSLRCSQCLETNQGECRSAENACDPPICLDALGFGEASSSLRRETKVHAGSFWQADHRQSVVEGGGLCGLDNYRTLCTPCHRCGCRLLPASLPVHLPCALPSPRLCSSCLCSRCRHCTLAAAGMSAQQG